MIFGNKQKGKAARDANNLFCFFTYEGNINLAEMQNQDERNVFLQQISEFGQTPHQLFTTEHPSKLEFSQRIPLGLSDLQSKSKGYTFRLKSFCKLESQVVFLGNSGSENEILYVLKNGITGYIKMEDLRTEKNSETSAKRLICTAEDNVSNRIYPFKEEKQAILAAGYSDCSFRLIRKNKEVNNKIDIIHKKKVQCIAVCEKCKIIACGSKDCRISLWRYDKKLEIKNFYPKEMKFMYGHNNEIIIMKINEILDILISVDKDGLYLIHDIRKGKFISLKKIDLNEKEIVIILEIHNNGFILIGTNLGRIKIYS